MYGPNGWGNHLNLDLFWTRTEHGLSEHGPWVSSRALVWSRQPCRLLASIYIFNQEYSITTLGLYGMTEAQQHALTKHLESFGLKRR